MRILIIKLGALGDVIRTTPLLRVLDGDITWVTSAAALPLVRESTRISRVVVVDPPRFDIGPESYDLVINLEDDREAAEMATSVAKGRIIGPFIEDGEVTYGESSSEWFDMSLSSRYGRKRADELKLRNRKTYQEIIFSALGKPFRGEEPVLQLPIIKRQVQGLVGIEARAGGVWPIKRWPRYDELAERLRARGYATKFFVQRDRIEDYADDINECEFVICGDTLAMHIALALKKRVVALFTCTSPHEIHGYDRLAKVVSPLLERYFYCREYIGEAADAIAVEDVERSFSALACAQTASAAQVSECAGSTSA